MNTREKAWKCWLEIARQLERYKVYVDSQGRLGLEKGCGGDIINIINRYL